MSHELLCLVKFTGPPAHHSPRLRAYIVRTRFHLLDRLARRAYGASVLP